MSEQDIKKTLAEYDKRIEQVEAKFGCVQPQKLDPKFEAEQDAHQAALTAFQTTRKDGMCLSLNSATPPAEAEALLKKLEEQKPDA